MGRSYTPTFRVVPETNGFHMTNACWDSKRYGRPSEKTAREYVQKFNESLQPDGCNSHIGKAYPTARMIGCQIVRQATDEVVASYRVPMFEVI